MEFNLGTYLMRWVSGDYTSPERKREFLKSLDEDIRLDERKRMSEFISKLGSKVKLEFDAYVEYLDNSSDDSPKQIKLNL